MTEYHFETHSPVDLVVEIGKGNVNVRCTETTESTVVVEGKHAEDVVVEQHGDSITVIEPGRGRIFGDNALRVDVVVPERQQPRGPHRQRRHPGRGPGRPRAAAQRLRRRAASTTVEGHLLVETGSGDIRVDDVRGDLKVKSGSGDVEIGAAGGTSSVSTGSGDVTVETARGTTVVKTGSGDLSVGAAHDDTSFSTGSGDSRSTSSTAAGSPSRAPPATCRSASRPASRCGPTSPPCRAPSAPTCRAPASRRRARTTSRCGPRPSAATSC